MRSILIPPCLLILKFCNDLDRPHVDALTTILFVWTTRKKCIIFAAVVVNNLLGVANILGAPPNILLADT